MRCKDGALCTMQARMFCTCKEESSCELLAQSDVSSGSSPSDCLGLMVQSPVHALSMETQVGDRPLCAAVSKIDRNARAG